MTVNVVVMETDAEQIRKIRGVNYYNKKWEIMCNSYI